MWRTIGISLSSYLFVVSLYAFLSYLFKLDEKIGFLLTEIFKSSLGIDVVKFFILNIISILLSDYIIRKFQSEENSIKFWKEKLDKSENKFKDLNRSHEELIHYVTILMNDYSKIACISDVTTKYGIENKVGSHIEKLKNHIPEEDIESI